eukprot:gene31169-39122_t
MSRASSNAESARQLSRLLTSSTANPLLREVIQRLSTWFESADTSGDGTVQMEELEQVFLAMGIAETKQELKQKFEWMDVNGDRSVDHSEFLEHEALVELHPGMNLKCRGVEMVTDPYVLLLDEPTSGLGATDTLVVTTALNSLTRTKRAVVAVVHQPRFQVFMLFHDLLLLYPGGRTVYFGPTHLAIVHFESIGFSPAHGVNPADFFLDVISGIVPKTGDESFHPSKLSLIWD